MANRTNYFFKQRLTNQELNLGFDKAEEADQNFVIDLDITGLVSGIDPTEQGPPSLSIDISEGAAYDQLGRRVRLIALTAVDLTLSSSGINTEPTVGGNERWISVFIRFDTVEDDTRIDGASNNVFFLINESIAFVIRVGPEAPVGLAPRVALRTDELLVCDVRRLAGQTTFLDADIDLTRREILLFLNAINIPVDSSTFSTLVPLEDNLQSLAENIDLLLTEHFAGTSNKHDVVDIVVDDAAFAAMAGVDAQAALESIDTLYDEHVTGVSDRHPATDIDFNDAALIIIDGATVQAALADLDADLNDHFVGNAFEHDASDINFAFFNWIGASNVQLALEEITEDLGDITAVTSGSSLVGIDALGGTFYSILGGQIRQAFIDVLAAINTEAVRFNVDHHGFSAPGASGTHRLVNWDMTADVGSEKLLAIAGDEQAATEPRMRLYWNPSSTFPTFSITFNAAHSGSGFSADRVGASDEATRYIFQIDLSSNQSTIRIQTKRNTSIPWNEVVGWDTEVHLGGDPGSLSRNTASFGDEHERGRLAVGGNQGQDGTQAVFGATGGNFKGYFRLGAPSTVTLVTTLNLNWPVVPTADQFNDDGFRVLGSSTAILEGVDAHWFGQYQATQ